MPPEVSGDSPTSFFDPSLTWKESEPAGTDSPPVEPPAADTASAITPEAATEPSDATPREGVAGDGQDTGPIPLDRHKAILEGERKQREALEAKLTGVAWAEEYAKAGVDTSQIKEALAICQGIDTDPIGFLDRFFPQLVDHPTLGAHARSWAGRVLGSHRTGEAAQPENGTGEPQPDFYTQDDAGNRTPFYSGPQLRKWQEWNARQIESRLEQRIAPIITREERAQRLDAAQAEYKRSWDATAAELDALNKDPLFAKHRDDVKAHLQSVDYKIPLKDAWLHVLTTKVIPTFGQTERAKVEADMRTQAAASSVNPGAAAPSTPADVKSFHDPRLKW